MTKMQYNYIHFNGLFFPGNLGKPAPGR